jgi:hypothetical protein
LALLALAASGAASADELLSPRSGSPRAAVLYVELPIGAARHRHKPAFGLRLQELAVPHAATAAAGYSSGARTLLDVPLLVRKNDPLRDGGAAMLLGKGAIVGIVVGAVIAVSVINDDGDGGGGY